MSETIRGLRYFASQDPFVIVGFILIGASAVLFFRLYKKVRTVGGRSYTKFTLPVFRAFSMSMVYLKYAPTKSWSTLPAYAAWLCTVAGIAFLVFGLLKL